MTDVTTIPSVRSALDVPRDGSLTRVELTWVAKRIEFWIRFGPVDQEQILDRRRRVVWFPPGIAFAFVRWAANDYGTTISRVDIVRTVASGEAYQTLPFVRPGGDILLTMQGWQRVERVLQMIDAVEGLGINPETVSPDHWRHVHSRLTAGQEPRAYTFDLHHASLLRRRVQS